MFVSIICLSEVYADLFAAAIDSVLLLFYFIFFALNYV